MSRVERQVINLYTNKLLSMHQIADRLAIAHTKVRYILDKFHIKRRSISDAITFLNITKYNKGSFKIKERLNLRQEKLKVAGTMLYWGEGTKSGSTVVLSNSDPNVVKLFLKFLREICGISEKRLRILLHIYNNQNEETLKRQWMSITKIPKEQFCKSFIHIRTTGTYKRTSIYGTISLRYSDKRLLDKINEWIKEYSERL